MVRDRMLFITNSPSEMISFLKQKRILMNSNNSIWDDKVIFFSFILEYFLLLFQTSLRLQICVIFETRATANKN